MWFGRNDKFRVELDNILWVCDGGTVWQYNPATAQVTLRNLRDVDLSNHPSHVLSRYLRHQSYRLKEQRSRQTVVEALPDDSARGAAAAASLTLWISTPAGIVEKLRSVDGNGNESTYQFSKTVLGANVADSLFKFTPPKEARIVDLRT
jgi:outer membrane lipoprotein carrier protein